MNPLASRRTIATLALALSISAPSLSAAAERGPSTPQERERIVALTRGLEAKPLAGDAKDTRSGLVAWWAAVPDLTVNFCTAFLGPFVDSKHKYESEISIQMMFSAGAYLIEHPGSDPAGVEVATAGVEGALRAYEAIVAGQPGLRDATLDGLRARRDAGTLKDVVAEALPRCGK